jgi:hypothetical protein
MYANHCFSEAVLEAIKDSIHSVLHQNPNYYEQFDFESKLGVTKREAGVPSTISQFLVSHFYVHSSCMSHTSLYVAAVF